MSTDFKSNFVIDITFNDSNKVVKFFQKEINKFVQSMKIDNYNSQDSLIEIKPKNQISFQDFTGKNKVDFDYFYENILADITKYDDNISLCKKVSITFDKRLCEKFDENSQRHYEVINVGGIDVMYYILFEIDEIYDCLYNNNL